MADEKNPEPLYLRTAVRRDLAGRFAAALVSSYIPGQLVDSDTRAKRHTEIADAAVELADALLARLTK